MKNAHSAYTKLRKMYITGSPARMMRALFTILWFVITTGNLIPKQKYIKYKTENFLAPPPIYWEIFSFGSQSPFKSAHVNRFKSGVAFKNGSLNVKKNQQ